MDYKLVILPIAEREIDDALFWYESRQKGLGIEFLTYLESYFLTLLDGNAIFQIKKKSFFRELPLKRFPFVIIYEIKDGVVIIYSVFNTHQNPNKKLK